MPEKVIGARKVLARVPFLWPMVNNAFSIACPRLLSIPSSIHDLGLLAQAGQFLPQSLVVLPRPPAPAPQANL